MILESTIAVVSALVGAAGALGAKQWHERRLAERRKRVANALRVATRRSRKAAQQVAG